MSEDWWGLLEVSGHVGAILDLVIGQVDRPLQNFGKQYRTELSFVSAGERAEVADDGANALHSMQGVFGALGKVLKQFVIAQFGEVAQERVCTFGPQFLNEAPSQSTTLFDDGGEALGEPLHSGQRQREGILDLMGHASCKQTHAR